MIRIETTAEFDAEGRFTATGQALAALEPGEHPIVVLVNEAPVATPVVGEMSSTLIREGDLLLVNAEPTEDADWDIRALIETDREERLLHLLGDWKS